MIYGNSDSSQQFTGATHLRTLLPLVTGFIRANGQGPVVVLPSQESLTWIWFDFEPTITFYMEGYPYTQMTYNGCADVINDISDYLTYRHRDRHENYPFSATVQSGHRVKFTLDVEKRPSRYQEIWGDRSYSRASQAVMTMEVYYANDLPEQDIRSVLDEAIRAVSSHGLDNEVTEDFRLSLRSNSGLTRLILHSWYSFPREAGFTYRTVQDLLVRLKAYYQGHRLWCDIYASIYRVATGYQAMGLYIKHEYPLGPSQLGQNGTVIRGSDDLAESLVDRR